MFSNQFHACDRTFLPLKHSPGIPPMEMNFLSPMRMPEAATEPCRNSSEKKVSTKRLRHLKHIRQRKKKKKKKKKELTGSAKPETNIFA